MNIFVFEPLNLRSQARCHPDKLVVKMQLETCQLLNNQLPENLRFYKTSHAKHPCSVWLGENNVNLSYGVKYLLSLIKEYEYRYNKVSNYRNHLATFEENFNIVEEFPEEYAIAINKDCLHSFVKGQIISLEEFQSVLETKRATSSLAKRLYQNYLLGYKCHYAEWRYCEPPKFWWDENLSHNYGRFCRFSKKVL